MKLKCKKFRTLMSEGSGEESELEKHLDSCQECSAWLERELAEAPQGLTPAQWQTATARCFPEKLSEQALEKPVEEPKKFWNSYFHGMTYGMVFGLSIVFGFALLSLRQRTVEEPPLPSLSQVSFVDTADRDLPVFFETKKNNVTFLPFANSELMSFVEFNDEIKFMEYNEEENL